MSEKSGSRPGKKILGKRIDRKGKEAMEGGKLATEIRWNM
jgi:hypothetical protein